MKIPQIHLQNAKVTSANFLLHQGGDEIDIIPIEGPWLNSISEIRTRIHKLMAAGNKSKKKACLLVRSQI